MLHLVFMFNQFLIILGSTFHSFYPHNEWIANMATHVLQESALSVFADWLPGG